MALSPGTRIGAYDVLAKLPRGTTVHALTSDGKRLLAATPAPTAAPYPLTVVMNWLTGIQ